MTKYNISINIYNEILSFWDSDVIRPVTTISVSSSSASPGLLCQMPFSLSNYFMINLSMLDISIIDIFSQSYGLWCPTPECAPWRTTSSSTSRWRTSSTPPSTSSPTSPTCSPATGPLVRFQIIFHPIQCLLSWGCGWAMNVSRLDSNLEMESLKV